MIFDCGITSSYSLFVLHLNPFSTIELIWTTLYIINHKMKLTGSPGGP